MKKEEIKKCILLSFVDFANKNVDEIRSLLISRETGLYLCWNGMGFYIWEVLDSSVEGISDSEITEARCVFWIPKKYILDYIDPVGTEDTDPKPKTYSDPQKDNTDYGEKED